MKVLFEIIQNLSIIIASGVAVWGINSWRREAKWKRRYEVAEEVLSLTYECEEKFKIIRSPFSHSQEGKSRRRSDHETPEESDVLDRAYVVIERFEKEKEPFNKLFSLKFRFITLFGKKAGEPLDELRKILNTIFFAANRLGQRYWGDQANNFRTEQLRDKHLKEMNENEAIIWAQYDVHDETATKIEACVLKIEEYCSATMEK